MSLLWPDAQTYISAKPNAEFLAKKTRELAIMGSTGSIGRNALSVAAKASGRLKIFALAGGRNMPLLAEQANQWQPPYLACLDDSYASILLPLLNYSPHILTGQQGYAYIASLPQVDCVLSAQAGSSGLVSTLAAAYAGKVIALANKESLVMAGPLIRRICKANGATILPVDSEHYAIFQCLAGRPFSEIFNLVLTASGGPFLCKSAAEINGAAPAAALNHPNWNMGAKISIDSATLMNKGLEYIEAMHLYGIENIKILIHPQSIIHSLVEYKDNSLLVQMAMPDMRLPISGCLLWPDCQQSFIKPLHLAEIGQLNFFDPDYKAFPCLGLAIGASHFTADEDWKKLGLNPACIWLNAANEAAVENFLAGKCKFGDIGRAVKTALEHMKEKDMPKAPSLPESSVAADQAMNVAGIVAKLDCRAREIANSFLAG